MQEKKDRLIKKTAGKSGPGITWGNLAMQRVALLLI